MANGQDTQLEQSSGYRLGLGMDLLQPHKNSRALITGGTQGLGFEIAKRLIDEGATQIIISGRDTAKGQAAAEKLSFGEVNCRFIKADVSSLADCEALTAKAIAEIGFVNCVVNSAANTGRGSLIDTTPEVFESHMNTNVRGPFFIMQAIVRDLIAKRKRGSIVNILSVAAHCGQSFLAPYSASKAGLSTLTKNVANAHRADRIRCNGINCGWMDTPGEATIQKKWHDADDSWLEGAEADQPFGQLVKPQEVAGLVSYLLSPNSGVMTGSIIDCDQNVVGSFPE